MVVIPIIIAVSVFQLASAQTTSASVVDPLAIGGGSGLTGGLGPLPPLTGTGSGSMGGMSGLSGMRQQQPTQQRQSPMSGVLPAFFLQEAMGDRAMLGYMMSNGGRNLMFPLMLQQMGMGQDRMRMMWMMQNMMGVNPAASLGMRGMGGFGMLAPWLMFGMN